MERVSIKVGGSVLGEEGLEGEGRLREGAQIQIRGEKRLTEYLTGHL